MSIDYEVRQSVDCGVRQSVDCGVRQSINYEVRLRGWRLPQEQSRILVVGGEDHTLANNAHLLTVQPPVAMATITAQLSNNGNYILPLQ